jgi:hypothetical protein
MAIPIKHQLMAVLIIRIVVRFCLILMGVSAILWSYNVLPLFWRAATFDNAAHRIIRGESFKSEIVMGLSPEIENVQALDSCQTRALHNAAIVRLRLLETAIASGERQGLDRNFELLQTAILKSLACSPADPFLWTILYWADSSTRGFSAETLRFLQMSYEMGSHEGWVALKRNRLAVAIYEQLPVGTARLVTEEFADLLESGYVQETASILEGAGWANRDALLQAITRVSNQKRQLFAATIYRDGYDLLVPGIILPEARPWR